MPRAVLLIVVFSLSTSALACAQARRRESPEAGPRAFVQAVDEPAAASVARCEAGQPGCEVCEEAKFGLIVNGGKPVVTQCYVRSGDGRGCRNGSSTVAWVLEPFAEWDQLGPLRLEIEGKGKGASPEAYGAQGHPTSAVLTPTHNRKFSRFPERLDLPEDGQTDWYYTIRLRTVRDGEVYACTDPIVIIKDPPG